MGGEYLTSNSAIAYPFADNAQGFLYVMCIAFSISIVSAYVLWHRDMF